MTVSYTHLDVYKRQERNLVYIADMGDSRAFHVNGQGFELRVDSVTLGFLCHKRFPCNNRPEQQRRFYLRAASFRRVQELWGGREKDRR